MRCHLAVDMRDRAILRPTPTQVNAKGLLRKIHPPQEVLEVGVSAEGLNHEVNEHTSWYNHWGQVKRTLDFAKETGVPLEIGQN